MRIIGPIFFNYTLNSVRDLEILDSFHAQLTDAEKLYAVFQQDGATAHISNQSMAQINVFPEDRLVSRGLWPPRFPDLTLCDFYLWGTLKSKVYADNPCTTDDLKRNITREIIIIMPAELQRVAGNVITRS